MGENGRAVGITAHHSVTSVDVTGVGQLVELDCQDVGVSLTGTTTFSALVAICEVNQQQSLIQWFLKLKNLNLSRIL